MKRFCITKVDMPDDKYSALLDRCKSAITTDGKGELLMTDDWGRAKIAYTIGKDNRGRWTYMRFRSMPEGVDEIQRGLKINEFVLRQLTVRTEEHGSDYNSLRENMARELQDRDRPRDWREERGGHRGGGRREYGEGGGGYRGGGGSYNDRGPSDYEAPNAEMADASAEDEE